MRAAQAADRRADEALARIRETEDPVEARVAFDEAMEAVQDMIAIADEFVTS